MKKIIIAICILLSACGESRNDKMTKLINEKKLLQENIQSLNDSTDYYLKLASYDNSIRILENLESADARLNKVNFSIDSLSKMK